MPNYVIGREGVTGSSAPCISWISDRYSGF
jgi:hypothetical protein